MLIKAGCKFPKKKKKMLSAILHCILPTKKIIKSFWCLYFNFADNFIVEFEQVNICLDRISIEKNQTSQLITKETKTITLRKQQRFVKGMKI